MVLALASLISHMLAKNKYQLPIILNIKPVAHTPDIFAKFLVFFVNYIYYKLKQFNESFLNAAGLKQSLEMPERFICHYHINIFSKTL